jgi:hypothetical protein
VNAHDPLLHYLLSTLLPLVIKTGLYFGIIRWQKHRASLLTCVILGFALILPSALVPLPDIIAFAAGIGLALYILSQYADVPILPEGLIIVFGIEIGFAFFDLLVLSSIIH